jgi:hypothetical protein
MERDGDSCVVCGSPTPFIASHLIPKRMGTAGAIEVMTRLSGGPLALMHLTQGLLIRALDPLVDDQQLGFYHVTVSYHMEFGIVLLITFAL